METMNQMIETQLAHRTIREFKAEPLDQGVLDTLFEAGRRTATSTGLQASSIIRITSPAVKQGLAEICRQEYVARVPELLVFIADQYRNRRIAMEQGESGRHAGDMDRFFQGFTDACLMAQNMTNAAEAMGLGAVYFGSILNDPEATVKLLGLPPFTFPVVGMGIGIPNEDPQIKPKMAMELRVFENSYETYDGKYLEMLTDYDGEMEAYYDLRATNRRSDSFTRQVAAKLSHSIPARAAIMNAIAAQGFDLNLKGVK